MDYHFLTYLRHSVVRAKKRGLYLVTDVPPEQMLAQPAGLLHPMWLLGHIRLRLQGPQKALVIGIYQSLKCALFFLPGFF